MCLCKACFGNETFFSNNDQRDCAGVYFLSVQEFAWHKKERWPPLVSLPSVSHLRMDSTNNKFFICFCLESLLCLLKDPSSDIIQLSLKQLLNNVDTYWPDISESLATLEAIHESGEFKEKKLLALLISKVKRDYYVYYLVPYQGALRFIIILENIRKRLILLFNLALYSTFYPFKNLTLLLKVILSNCCGILLLSCYSRRGYQYVHEPP